MSSFLSTPTDVSVQNVWGRIVFLTVVTCGVLHAAGCIFLCWSLIRRDVRFLLAVFVYFLVGLLHSFMCSAPLAFAVAWVLLTLQQQTFDTIDMIVYAAILVAVSMYFSLGRIPEMYAL
jgi:hypothetical protein